MEVVTVVIVVVVGVVMGAAAIHTWAILSTQVVHAGEQQTMLLIDQTTSKTLIGISRHSHSQSCLSTLLCTIFK